MSEQTRTFDVPLFKKNRLLKKLDALNRKALKLKVWPLEYIVSDVWEKTIKEDKKTRLVQMVTVTFKTITFSLKGWSFLATIEHTDNGNIFTKLGDTDIPLKYRTVDKYCEHCKSYRRRNNTYLVYNEKKKRIVQVGSTCINSYLGFDATALMNHATLMYEFETSERDGYGDKPVYVVPLDMFLCLCKAVIDDRGYVSKKQQMTCEMDDYKATTGNTAWWLYFSIYSKLPERDKKAYNKSNTDETKKYVEDLLLWWADYSKDKKDDYTYNLNTIIKNGYVLDGHYNLMASIFPTYHFYLKKLLDEKEEKKKPSEHIGREGEKVERNVTVRNVFNINTMFGLSVVHNMITEEGDYLVWFCNGKDVLNLDGKYHIRATVKRHQIYKDKKQTVLKNLKAMEIKA